MSGNVENCCLFERNIWKQNHATIQQAILKMGPSPISDFELCLALILISFQNLTDFLKIKILNSIKIQ